MGLFSKKKDSKDSKDAKNVKDASIAPPPGPPIEQPAPAPLSSEPAAPQTTPQQDFVNPFQQGSDGTTPTVTAPTADAPLQVNPNMLDSPFQTGNTSTGIQVEDIQEMVDETVEKIIEEKWDKVVTNVEKVVSWKEKMEEDLNLMKEDIGNVKTAFEKLERKLIGKINDYDKDILDVSSEIKALEKVFQKITPTLVNNVNELERIATDLKGVKDSKQKEKGN